jgi:diguanylate cyclase (GGDEF)-like protein
VPHSQGLLARLEQKGSLFWLTTGCLLVAGVGIADVVTGSEVAFGLFYLIPIALVAWFSGGRQALTISLVSSAAWFIADDIGGQAYSRPIIRYWNAAIRLGFFVVVTLLIPAMKALEREKGIARIDSLTGAANRRLVFETLQSELDRSQRYKCPFTVAYIDVDSFKAVNDQFGHRTGDQLLCAVVHRAKSHLRRTDLLARLGGDEFILLLPEIGPDAARTTISKIQSALLDEMERRRWPVTFSIGSLTYQDGPITVDDLIRGADDLMYSVKKTGKNAIAYGVHAGEPHPGTSSVSGQA